MKKSAIIIMSLFFSVNLLAECVMNGIWVYSSSKSISRNSIIVIEGFSLSQRIIDSLNLKYPLYLLTDDHKIHLEVVDICIGEYYLSQAILQPTEKLISGKNYQLTIDNLKDWEQDDLNKWNNNTNTHHEPISWIVDLSSQS